MTQPRVVLAIGPGSALRAREFSAAHTIVLGDPALTEAWPELDPAAIWPQGLHRFTLGDNATLTTGAGDVLHLLAGLVANVDACFLHPKPEWRESALLYRQLARLATPQARLVLHESAAPWPLINAAGFRQIAEQEAIFRGGPHRRAIKPSTDHHHAIVIGAGLAGSAAAHRLAERGWRITLIDEAPAPAQGASGNLAGVFSPMLSKDDNRTSRLSRASFLYLLRELHTLKTARWAPCGVMQFAKDAADEALLATIIERHAHPKDFCEWLDVATIAQRFGLTPPCPGVFFPQGGWVNPPSLVAARLAHPNISTRYSTPITDIARHDGQWIVSSNGKALEAAPVLILANGPAAANFAQTRALHFKKVRGQVTHLPAHTLPDVAPVWQRDGYLTPAVDGVKCLAATYDFDNPNPALDPDSHRTNLNRIPSLFPGNACTLDPATLSGRVGFRALTIDRLPLIGALPDFSSPPKPDAQLFELPRHPGLFGLLGLGSRGITWSALAGEILASQINAEPLPIEHDLMDAIDPARFWLRTLRTE